MALTLKTMTAISFIWTIIIYVNCNNNFHPRWHIVLVEYIGRVVEAIGQDLSFTSAAISRIWSQLSTDLAGVTLQTALTHGLEL